MPVENLKSLRKEIDRIDKGLFTIMKKRFLITNKIGIAKAKNNLPTRDLKREKILYAERLKLGEKIGLSREFTLKLFKLIINEVIKKHKEIKKEWKN